MLAPNYALAAMRLAQGSPIHLNESAFHKMPPYMFLTVAAVVGAIIVRNLAVRAHKISPDAAKSIIRYAGDFLEMALMISAVAALALTPLFQSIVIFMGQLENSINLGFGHVIHVSAAIMGLAILVLAAWWYAHSESLIAALLLGLAAIVFANSAPIAAEVITWVANHVGAFVWNGMITLANKLTGLSFTVHTG